ncbi:MAG: DUF1206 domain-containing protein [Thermoleophilia bacterium]|nr:DUF1206 domain-containing protein [Thermoleophilia bacterium]
MGVAEAKRDAAGVARGPWVARAARLGHLARGSLYAVVGALAILVAVGARRRAPDREGALRAVAEQPLGELLVALLALGFLGFAAWRISQAVFARRADDGSRPGLLKRAGYGGLGVFYLFLGGLTFAFVLGLGRSSSSEKQETRTVFDLPLGRYVVGAVGAGLLIAGGVNAYRSITGKFREYLREHELGKKAREWAVAVGVVGHLARAIVFTLIGFFVLRAAVEYDASEAVGLDGALAKVAKQPFGPVLLGLVAAGLLAFAAFCFLQARHGEN